MRQPAKGRGSKPRGATDPLRRERIGRAALKVIGERGVEGLTHRAVAAEADVALGSTTYHFKTLDDILLTAMEQAVDANVELMRQWGESVEPDADLAAALADLLERLVGQDNARTRVEYELCVAAIRRPALRALTSVWATTLTEILAGRGLSYDAATVVSSTIDGLLLREMVSEERTPRDDLERIARLAIRAADV